VTIPLARLLLIAALSLIAVGPSGASTSATVPGAESDVRLLAQQLEAIHPDLFAGVSRARFRSAVERASAAANELSENELLVELMRLAALPGIGNGHTGIFPGDPQHRRDLHLFPLRLYAFPGGTYVVDEKGKAGLVGARVTAIGGVPYAEVARRVRPLVPHDNASNLQGLLPHYVLTAEVLDGLGIADGVSPLEFTFTQGGRPRTMTLSPVSARSYVATFRDPIHGHYPSLLPRRKPTPLYLRRSASLLWVGTLDRGRAVFVGFNSVQRPYTLVERITKLSHRPQVKRVIVDLRLNGGGDNTTYASLLGALTNSSVNRKGRLFVLIGRATFSAAANFAADVDRLTKATFVGEPTGGFVRGYGDTVPVLLPKSGIGVRIATRYWDFGKGSGDRRLAIYPDRKVLVTVADFLAGRDPVLTAALKS
jgi:Peptidase family S41